MGETVPALEKVPAWALDRVSAFAAEERLFRHTRRVLVAVSGGPDSVACLLLLARLRERFGLELLACHFDHRLRPEGGDERAWVRDLCESLSLSLVTGEGDVATRAREGGLSVETAAREMRYSFLAFVAGERRADCIATGHTADDQAETVILHIARGSGVRGLRGMLPSAPLPGSPAHRLVRPLLVLRSDETREVCQAAGIVPLQDPTNDDPALLRNRVRLEVLPALRRLNPSVDRALCKLAEHARDAFRTVEREAAGCLPLSRGSAGSILAAESFRSLGSEARMLVVERELGVAGIQTEVNRTKILNLDQIVRAGTGRVPFGDGEVEISIGFVRVGPPTPPLEASPVALEVPGTTAVDGWRIHVHTEARGQEGRPAARVVPQGALRARSLMPGDRLLEGTRWRRARDALVKERVPLWERRRAIAIVDSRGVLAIAGPAGWVCGGQPRAGNALHVELEPPAPPLSPGGLPPLSA